MTAPPPADGASVEVVIEQAMARQRTEGVPLAQLSIELGHLYLRDFTGDHRQLRRQFARVAPWAETAARVAGGAAGARVSTCFLIDDYFSTPSTPDQVIPELLAAATATGLRVDYLARESACVRAGDADLAAITTGRLVAEPPPGTTGARPPASEVGWLCNGQRSPVTPAGEAMAMDHRWMPPRQNVPDRHSVFVDIELWDEQNGRRTWSCAFLAAIWQLLRLGLLRDRGRSIVRPQRWTGPWPERWSDLPPIVRLTEHPQPFCAYRTMSILDGRFLPIEHAVRVILDQVVVDAAAAAQVVERAVAEGIEVPTAVHDRIDYHFLSW